MTDEQVDTILARLAAETSLNEASVNEIAASPQLWWAVQRNIALERSAASSPWPPPKNIFRWFAIGLPSLAVLAIAFTYFTFVGRDTAPETTVTATNISEVEALTIPRSEERSPEVVGKGSDKQPRTPVANVNSQRRASWIARSSITPVKKPKAVPEADEIRTDFIALTYSRRPESGHLVRVKVPSSMMVNLGLVDSVEKPSSMVNAEVVVGDDGQTHAIRFIRQ